MIPAVKPAAGGESSFLPSAELSSERFWSLEVVVGRGAHSTRGVPKLRPLVARYLASKGFQMDVIAREKGDGVVVVRLTGGTDE